MLQIKHVAFYLTFKLMCVQTITIGAHSKSVIYALSNADTAKQLK